MRSIYRLSVFAALLSLLVSFGSSAGGAAPRFVVVIEETVEGNASAVPEVQGAIEAGLMGKGYKVVAPEQVTAARADASVALMMEGKVPERMTALDAEFLVAGKVDATKMGRIEGSDFHVYMAGVKTSVIRIGTGEILHTFLAEVRGDGISEKMAARRTLRNAGRKTVEDLMRKMPEITAKGGQIELVVHGIPDHGRMEEVVKALEGCAEIKNVAVRYTSEKMTKLDLDSKLGALKLASALNKSKKVPVKIVRTSSGSILSRYNAARTLRLGMVISEPINRLGARYKWLGSVLPDVLAAELQNVEFLDLRAPAGAAPAFRRGRVTPGQLAKISKDNGGAPLVAVLGAGTSGKEALLDLKIYETLTGKVVFSAAANGDPDNLPPVVRELAGKLSSDLLPAIARRRKLARFKEFSKAAGVFESGAGARGPTARIRLAAIKIENLFPSRFGHYQSQAVGHVVLRADEAEKGTEGEDPRDIKVSVFIPGFMSLPSETTFDKLPGGTEVKVPVRLTLQAEKVFGVDENTPAQAKVELSFTSGKSTVKSSRVVPLIVFDRNAIDWSSPQSIASFVTFREESIKTLARKAISAREKENLPEGVRDAAALFNALRLQKLKYLKDPINPFRSRRLDYVQYPRETLGYRTGDCDDLAVLYASLLESVGVQTAFITTPGHILVAFKLPPGVSPTEITYDPDLYLEVEPSPAGITGDAKSAVRGTAFRADSASELFLVKPASASGDIWIPVETTSLNRSFSDAWQRGAREVNRFKGSIEEPGKLALVTTRRAWASYPAVSLPRDVKEIPLDVAALERTLDQDSREIGRLRDRSYRTRLAQLKKRVRRNGKDTPLRNDYAVLLARGGELAKSSGELGRALDANPTDAGTLTNLGNVRLLQGKFPEAVDLYHKALKQDEKRSGQIYANVGLAFYSFGDLEKARQAFAASARSGGQALFATMGLVPPREVEGTLQADKAPRKREVIERELEKVLEEALKRADAKKKTSIKRQDSKDLFSNPLPSAGRRGDDPASRRRLVDLLRWMR